MMSAYPATAGLNGAAAARMPARNPGGQAHAAAEIGRPWERPTAVGPDRSPVWPPDGRSDEAARPVDAADPRPGASTGFSPAVTFARRVAAPGVTGADAEPRWSATPHNLAVDRTTSGGGEDVPLASGTPSGDAGREGAAVGGCSGSSTAAFHGGLTATVHARLHDRYFGTSHAAELYPDLEPLTGWSWWWVGSGTTMQLVGYHRHDGKAVDLLYIDGDEHAALTRVAASGTLYVHKTGAVAAMLTLLDVEGAS
ncbi:MAG: hypothetical protein ACRDQ5_24395 [Sciscionella sp.]